jgi:hypothetical protein
MCERGSRGKELLRVIELRTTLSKGGSCGQRVSTGMHEGLDLEGSRTAADQLEGPQRKGKAHR